MPSIEESAAEFLKWHGVPYFPSKLLRQLWGRKIAYMVAVVIAPEWEVSCAMYDYLAAKKGLRGSVVTHGRLAQDLIPGYEEDYELANAAMIKARSIQRKMTMSHTFFANMGGFILRTYTYRFRSPMSTTDPSISSTAGQSDESVSSPLLQHDEHIGDYECLGKFVWSYKLFLIHLLMWTLRTHNPKASKYANSRREDIKDLSKSDAFTKTFACVQSVWLCTQCLARACKVLNLFLIQTP